MKEMVDRIKLFFILAFVCMMVHVTIQSAIWLEQEEVSIQAEVTDFLLTQVMSYFFPLGEYLEAPKEEDTLSAWLMHLTVPLTGYIADYEDTYWQEESVKIYDAESLLYVQQQEEQETIVQIIDSETSVELEEEQEEPEEEQETEQEKKEEVVLTKKQSFTKEQLCDVEFVKNHFFTEDATTKIKEEQLQYAALMEYDASIENKKDENAPQILIYHTHAQEAYVDSNPNDISTTILGVGEYLSAILRTEYGFTVLHHMEEYDKESRDYAYTYAAKGLEKVLEENPSIEVVIDLHRDAVKEGTKLVTEVDGQQVAQFMFFNGMSYTNELGELTGLPNPYVQENLAFSFQLKLAAEEYYPGVTRKNYLKGYRYNMHYMPKSLLVELGAQTNTVDEAMRACKPLAKILAMVLNGDYPQN